MAVKKSTSVCKSKCVSKKETVKPMAKKTTVKKVVKTPAKSTCSKSTCKGVKCASKTAKPVKKNPGVTSFCKEAKKALSKVKQPAVKKQVVSKEKEVVAPIQYVVTQTFVYGKSKVKQIVTKSLIMKESEKKVAKVKLLNKATVEEIRKIIALSSKLSVPYCKIKQEEVKGGYQITLISEKKSLSIVFKNKILD